jgi:TonB family protein
MKRYLAFLLMGIALPSWTMCGWAQQEALQVPDLARRQAVSVVLKHYSINPLALDPKTQQPLPRDGSWSTGKTVPSSCPQTKDVCLEVFYRVAAANVKCSWVVLLNADGTDGSFLDQNDDSEHFLIRRLSEGEAKVLVNARKKPVFPQIAIMAHVSGTVVMNVIVGKSGEVQGVKVISGPPMEQQAAADAARAWVFKPLMVGARAIPFEVQLAFSFETTGPPFGTVTMKP